MNWYYVEAGRQAGPVDDAGLNALVASGKILPETLVWREGMANWQAYREVQPAIPGAPAAAGGSSAEAVCAECGGIFPLNDTVLIGNARVCANCKPVFVQKMREGVSVGGAGGNAPLRYAGFWIRFAAKILDAVVLIIVFVAVGVVLAIVLVAMRSGPISPVAARAQGQMIGFGFDFLGIGANIVYSGFFLGKYGATPGKMICGLRVVDSQGARISFGRSFARPLAEILSALICDIGYIIAAFDSEKRALHDHICSTRVIYK